MQVIIRTYITNETRFEYLRRTIQSCVDKKMFPITVVDNMSPGDWGEQIVSLGSIFPFIRFVRSELCPGTMNGFIASLVAAPSDEYCLYLEDDVVLGKGINEALCAIHPGPGLVSLYAAYDRIPKNPDDLLWEYPTDAFYGLIAMCISPWTRQALLGEWERISLLGGYPPGHADIWVKNFCLKNDFKIWNTVKDYAQHIGNQVRSINGGKIDAVYESIHFVGE